MQYSPSDFTSSQMVELQWHGDDTRVLFQGEGEKRDVKKGEVVSVTVEDAKRLVRYSSLWTKKGDKPVKQPFVDRRKRMLSADEQIQNARNLSHGDPEYTVEMVDKMKDKEEIMKHLRTLHQTFNKRAETEDLKALLRDVVANELLKNEEARAHVSPEDRAEAERVREAAMSSKEQNPASQVPAPGAADPKVALPPEVSRPNANNEQDPNVPTKSEQDAINNAVSGVNNASNNATPEQQKAAEEAAEKAAAAAGSKGKK